MHESTYYYYYQRRNIVIKKKKKQTSAFEKKLKPSEGTSRYDTHIIIIIVHGAHADAYRNIFVVSPWKFSSHSHPIVLNIVRTLSSRIGSPVAAAAAAVVAVANE